jgi:hypothetical protein
MVKSPHGHLPRELRDKLGHLRLVPNDKAPTLLRQFAGVFLVTPGGDVWRVFDAEGVRAERCVPPSTDDQAMVRVFVLPSNETTRRIYRFAPNDDRSVTSERLYEQLQKAFDID